MILGKEIAARRHEIDTECFFARDFAPDRKPPGGRAEL
jgi:hypothetical protein